MDIHQARAVNAILQHDDSSTGAELVYYFVHELGVAPGEAWRAVRQRAPGLDGQRRRPSSCRDESLR